MTHDPVAARTGATYSRRTIRGDLWLVVLVVHALARWVLRGRATRLRLPALLAGWVVFYAAFLALMAG